MQRYGDLSRGKINKLGHMVYDRYALSRLVDVGNGFQVEAKRNSTVMMQG